MGSETETMRWNEFVEIAETAAPALVPLLQYAREGGSRAKRYKTGAKAGALYLTMAKSAGADYSRWGKLNCGPGLVMYQKVQELSQIRWRTRSLGHKADMKGWQ